MIAEPKCVSVEVTLEERFFDFCKDFPGAERVDDIVDPRALPAGTRIADFLFHDRTIVAEVKTLTRETSQKLVAYMESQGVGPSVLADGDHTIKSLFLGLEDGEAKYEKAITLITKPITDGLHEANKQIRDTKALFGIPEADGLLIILNDQVTLAGPPLVFERLGHRLGKRNDDGTLCYTAINHALHVGEMYTLADENVAMNFSVKNPLVPERNNTSGFVAQLMKDWATHNGQTFTMAGSDREELLKRAELVITVAKTPPK